MGVSTGDKIRELITSEMDARTEALLIEAGRTADRLDDIDAIIHGKDVLSLLRFRLSDNEGRVAEVKFDGVLAEARQQGAALKALLAQVGVPQVEATVIKRRSSLDELRARRESRVAEGVAEAKGSASS